MMEKIKYITNKIKERGGQAYLVGGYVRDLLLGLPSKDIDIATNLKPEVILSIFDNTKLVGKSFGVIIVDDVEVASFRSDVYNPEGKQEGVVLVETLEEDVKRRDFTINALALNENNEVIDYVGGLEDIENKRIRFVGNPDERIKEDPIRIIRGLRFVSKLNFKIEKASFEAMKRNIDRLSNIPKERIRIELMKVMKSVNKPSIFFEFLRKINAIKYVFKEFEKTFNVDGGSKHAETVWEHCILSPNYIKKKYPLLRVAALFHDIGKPLCISKDERGVHFYGHELEGQKIVEKELRNLKFSNEEIDYISNIIRHHMFYFYRVTKKSTYRRFMSRLADVGVPIRDILRMRIADRKANLSKTGGVTNNLKRTLKIIREIEKNDQIFQLKNLALNGNDLIEMGFEPGPLFSKILNYVLEVVIKHPELNKKEILKKIVSYQFIYKV